MQFCLVHEKKHMDIKDNKILREDNTFQYSVYSLRFVLLFFIQLFQHVFFIILFIEINLTWVQIEFWVSEYLCYVKHPIKQFS